MKWFKRLRLRRPLRGVNVYSVGMKDFSYVGGEDTHVFEKPPQCLGTFTSRKARWDVTIKKVVDDKDNPLRHPVTVKLRLVAV